MEIESGQCLPSTLQDINSPMFRFLKGTLVLCCDLFIHSTAFCRTLYSTQTSNRVWSKNVDRQWIELFLFVTRKFHRYLLLVFVHCLRNNLCVYVRINTPATHQYVSCTDCCVRWVGQVVGHRSFSQTIKDVLKRIKTLFQFEVARQVFSLCLDTKLMKPKISNFWVKVPICDLDADICLLKNNKAQTYVLHLSKCSIL